MEILLVAAGELFEPARLVFLVAGVVLGLVIGVIPGIGGLFGLTILIPVTYGLDPVAAFALLLGMAAVTTTSDTIPAVLLGIPGTVGAAATVLDGHALAKQRQAARALGAGYSASLIGGLFGALVLALSLPVMRPMVLLLNFGDLLAITLFGVTLVAMLSGSSPLKGVLAALLGALVAYTGLDPHEGVERWTFGEVYLWDGVPVAIVFLGLFGVSELASLVGRGQIQQEPAPPEPGGLRRGIGETLRNLPLVLRSSALGSLLGAVPGVGVTVIEWVAYGDAARHRGDGPPFGEGNIRGVIAPESANNAKEGGTLLPTLAFGIPGSASMAILLGAFTIHGIVPGPDMLEDQAPLLVTMVLSIALANILGAVICLGMTRPLARLAMVRATTLAPIALAFVALGAFYASKSWMDLACLFAFGALGLAMKGFGWSRPAFALGFVLGPNLERFFFLSWQISGWDWLAQPVVILLLAAAAATLLRQLRRHRRAPAHETGPTPPGEGLFVLAVAAATASALAATLAMPFAAAIFPRIVAAAALALALIVALRLVTARGGRKGAPEGAPEGATSGVSSGATGGGAGGAAEWGPGLRLLSAVAALSLLILALGHLAGPAAFILLAAAVNRAPGPLQALATAAAVSAAAWAIFDFLVPQTWPEPWLLALLPG